MVYVLRELDVYFSILVGGSVKIRMRSGDPFTVQHKFPNQGALRVCLPEALSRIGRVLGYGLFMQYRTSGANKIGVGSVHYTTMSTTLRVRYARTYVALEW